MREQANEQGVSHEVVRFTRRAVRGALGLSDTQLRVHLERLVSLEYVRMYSGQNGSFYTYSLAFDGDAACDAPQAMGLAEPDGAKSKQTSRGKTATSRGKATTLRGQSPDLAGTSRPPCGYPAAPSRGSRMPLKPKPDKACSDSALEHAENARSRTPASVPRLNGHAVETLP